MLLEDPPYPEWHRPYSPLMTPPNKFWGLITRNGEEVPDGQTVYGVFSTKDDSGNDLGLRVRGKCITEMKIFEGRPYNYLFNVPREGIISWEQGELVEFYLGKEKARETANLSSEAIIKLDLHIGEAPPPTTEFPWVLPASLIVGLVLFASFTPLARVRVRPLGILSSILRSLQ